MGSIPGPTQWVKNPVLLWLWGGLAATALILPVAWELPYAVDAALKNKKKKKKERERERASEQERARESRVGRTQLCSSCGLVTYYNPMILGKGLNLIVSYFPHL